MKHSEVLLRLRATASALDGGRSGEQWTGREAQVTERWREQCTRREAQVAGREAQVAERWRE